MDIEQNLNKITINDVTYYKFGHNWFDKDLNMYSDIDEIKKKFKREG